jgi:uncharacterized protein DUF3866
VRLVWGVVLTVDSERAGLQRLLVKPEEGEAAHAVCYTALTGECATGDEVLLNTTAVDLALGTGGSHVVVARARVRGHSAVALDDPSPGHIMKLRYTPLQRDVLAVESPESPSHDVMREAVDVCGMPVVCCGLHSQVSIVAAAIRERRPEARIAYVMTDEAALPLALSELVAACLAAGLLDCTVTCGQAFGGMFEAVTLHSGLVAARLVAGADVAIVAIGPGVVGTGTALGHGGIAQGEAINAASVVGGRPVATLRVSFADLRDRHRGVSHHSLTALTRIALAQAAVAVPLLDAAAQAIVDEDLAGAGVWDRHVRADAPCDLPDCRGVSSRSMGRGPEDDPAFFLAAAAAGAVAAGMLEQR